jgi:hypothetical protein
MTSTSPPNQASQDEELPEGHVKAHTTHAQGSPSRKQKGISANHHFPIISPLLFLMVNQETLRIHRQAPVQQMSCLNHLLRLPQVLQCHCHPSSNPSLYMPFNHIQVKLSPRRPVYRMQTQTRFPSPLLERKSHDLSLYDLKTRKFLKSFRKP